MSLHITSNTKSGRIRPATYDELKSIIERELDRQGPDADLNFIDTSEIDDMSLLFRLFDVRNIKIDQWDVSNVKYMSYMFTSCKDFNCDLSSWDVSNVITMNNMFFGCKNFNCDLSKWDVSKVFSRHTNIFKGCSISEHNKPKFR